MRDRVGPFRLCTVSPDLVLDVTFCPSLVGPSLCKPEFKYPVVVRSTGMVHRKRGGVRVCTWVIRIRPTRDGLTGNSRPRKERPYSSVDTDGWTFGSHRLVPRSDEVRFLFLVFPSSVIVLPVTPDTFPETRLREGDKSRLVCLPY